MTAQPIPLRRFYVYVLKNEAGEVFYVGRGTGGRMMQHMARSHNDGVNGRLSEAVAGDERVTAEVVSWHATAIDAADEERRLIKSFPAGKLSNVDLVNKMPSKTFSGNLLELAACTEELRSAEADRRRFILACVEEGWPMGDIAKAAGTSRAHVARMARENGMAPRLQGRPRRPAQP